MERILILDFGGQYNQLIARRVRECHVYCEVHPYTMPLEEIRSFSPIGIIFTGGPNSVYEAGSPQVDPAIFELGIPVLGICYGCQLLAQVLGGQVTPAQEDSAREYGKTVTWYDRSCPIFQGLPEKPWRLYGARSGRIPADGPFRRLRPCGDRGRGTEVLRRSVSSGGQPYGIRHADAP